MKEYLKYLVYSIVIYIILTFIAENMNNNDKALIIIIVVGSLYYYDNYMDKNVEGYQPNDDVPKFSSIYKGDKNEPYYKLQGIEDDNKDALENNLTQRNIDLEENVQPIEPNEYKGLSEDNKFVETLKEKQEERKEKLKQYKSEGGKFTYGYSYLHPDYWNGHPYKKKPVCKNVKPCSVCPKQTEGYNQMLMKVD